jgi:hypothetical protein
MKIAVITMLVFVIAWSVAYVVFIRHWLMQYAITAGVITRIEAAEGSVWSKIKLWFEGKKALLVAFVMSGLGAMKSATDSTVKTVTGLQPTDLDPLKDQGVWHAFFSDGVVLKIMSGLALAAGLLAIKGHLTAAKIEPAKADPATPAT